MHVHPGEQHHAGHGRRLAISRGCTERRLHLSASPVHGVVLGQLGKISLLLPYLSIASCARGGSRIRLSSTTRTMIQAHSCRRRPPRLHRICRPRPGVPEGAGPIDILSMARSVWASLAADSDVCVCVRWRWQGGDRDHSTSESEVERGRRLDLDSQREPSREPLFGPRCASRPRGGSLHKGSLGPLTG